MKKLIIALFLCLAAAAAVPAQDIILDQPVRAGELTLFPSLRNKNEYYYVSDKPRLARDDRGQPQFSFLRYVDNKGSAPGEADITEGDGGGIVHAVIELNVTEEQLSVARQELRRFNPSGVIRGAAMYEGGTIALISSVSDPEAGFSRKVLGLGKAPILDGQKAAVSIILTKLGSKILWESFQTPTPDMSFSFEMELKGYNSPKGAVIEANFDQVYQHQSFSGAAITRQGGVMLAGEINAAYEDLSRSGAIKVTAIDPDEDIQKAIDDAYSKLTRMMFEPAGMGSPGTPSSPALPGTTQPTMLDRAQRLLSEGRRDALEDFLLLEGQEEEVARRQNTETSPGGTGTPTPRPAVSGGARDDHYDSMHGGASRPAPTEGYAVRERYAYNRPAPSLPTTAVVIGYTMRTVRQKGVFRIDLNKYTVDNVTLRFDQNVGRINCEDCFRQINISDPFYKQREIAAILDGYNAQDFQNYINFVAVSFRKTHQNGQVTNADLRIDRTKFNQQGNYFKFLYGWNGDDNRTLWNEYEYKTVWNFFGGASVELPWVQADLNSIGLSPPYTRKVIDIEMDASTAESENIRSAEVKVYYSVEGKEMVKQVRLNPRSGVLTAQVEVLQPASYIKPNADYQYEVSWIMADGSTRQSKRKSSANLVIFADQL